MTCKNADSRKIACSIGTLLALENRGKYSASQKDEILPLEPVCQAANFSETRINTRDSAFQALTQARAKTRKIPRYFGSFWHSKSSKLLHFSPRRGLSVSRSLTHRYSEGPEGKRKCFCNKNFGIYNRLWSRGLCQMKNFTFIDLFCGCGGFSLGLERAGLTGLAAIDFNAEAVAVFKKNLARIPFILQKDLTEFAPVNLAEVLNTNEIDVIVGGPPCQGFSTVRQVDAGCSQEDLWRALTALTPSVSSQHGPRLHPNSPARSYIQFLWNRSQPASGTVVETYLRKRGIICAPPPSLRFLPNHLHKPTETSWPVMLAAVSNASGNLRGIHRTYLASDGFGKAAVQPPRMTLGPVGGFACHLAEATKEMAVAEGIETGLSVQLTTSISTWAALNAGNLARMILPPLPLASLVIIAADADTVGLRSAKAAALRWKAEGWRVEIMVPSRPGADFNDLLMEVSL